MPGIRDLPGAERPREKLLSLGAGSLSNAELLAVLLGSGTREDSSLQLAAKVLALEPDGLGEFARYQPEEFMAIPGIKDARAAVISAAIEFGRRVGSARSGARPLANTPAKAAALFMSEMRVLRREELRVLMLNVKSELIACETVSVGSLNSSISHPREVFSRAVRKGAHAVIIMHNHPSGDPTPSAADIETTAQLESAGAMLGISVVDHIVIGDGSYVSFRERGLLSGGRPPQGGDSQRRG